MPSKEEVTPPQPVSDETRAEMIRLAEEGQRLSAAILPYATAARRRGDSDESVLNALEFVVLFQFELNTCVKAVAQSLPGLEAKFHARSLVLTVIESLLTMRRLLARDFRSQLVAALREPALDQKLKSLHSEVDKLFEDCNSRFGEVRDGLAAHRDADPEVRLGLLACQMAAQAGHCG
jgi:hypothetical protein